MTTHNGEHVELLHASAGHNDSRTLCGDVHEGDQTLDIPSPLDAGPGQRVTCQGCLSVIREVHQKFNATGMRR